MPGRSIRHSDGTVQLHTVRGRHLHGRNRRDGVRGKQLLCCLCLTFPSRSNQGRVRLESPSVQDCNAGYYAPERGGAITCSLCKLGKYQPSSGKEACVACVEGKFSNDNRFDCIQCTAGTYVYNNSQCKWHRIRFCYFTSSLKEVPCTRRARIMHRHKLRVGHVRANGCLRQLHHLPRGLLHRCPGVFHRLCPVSSATFVATQCSEALPHLDS